MAKKACKCAEVECEECPEWIFTLADLIMCMMGLFVLLWVLKPAPGKESSAVDDPKALEVIAAVRDYFDWVPDSQNPDKVDALRLARKLRDMKGNAGQSSQTRQGAEGTDSEVISIRKGDQAIVGSRVLFDVGSDQLTGEARRILDQVAVLVKGHRNIMLVKGHTSADDFPDGASAQQKLDLSIRRAKVVADYLASQGVEGEILRVLGCSTFEPVVQRAYTPESRQLNRRVEVEATNRLVSEYQDRVAPERPAEAGKRPASH